MKYWPFEKQLLKFNTQKAKLKEATIMSITAFLTYAIALGIAGIIPGPGVAALVGRALGSGFQKSLPMLMGIILGDIVYLTFAVAGLALIAKTFAGVFVIVKIGGACYLLYLAYQFWVHGIKPTNVNKGAGKREGIATFLAGFAVTMANPKTIIFYIALLPSVINIASVTLDAYFALAAITAVVLFMVLSPYILLASKARETFKNEKSLKIMGRSAATILTGTAGWILARG